MDDLRLKLRLMDAATSPNLLRALTLYNPASVSITSSNSRATKYLLCASSLVIMTVRLFSASCVSPRNQVISGLGLPTSWHSNTSRLPSSSCRRVGFCVKLGAKSSETPILLKMLRTSRHYTGRPDAEPVPPLPEGGLFWIDQQSLSKQRSSKITSLS